MRRREVPDDGPVRSTDPWWADQLDACIEHYWAWRGRRWLTGPVAALPAVRFMEEARELCLRRHGVDPLERRPRGRDFEGRWIDR